MTWKRPFQGHECENSLYLLHGARLAYGYYETLLGSRYRPFRIRKKLTLDDLQIDLFGAMSRPSQQQLGFLYLIAAEL